MFIIYVSAIIFVLVATPVFYFLFRYLRRKRILSQLQAELFLIRLPYVPKEGKELKKEIGLFEQFVSALGAFKKPFVFEAAVPYIGEEIHFYISVPSRIGGALARQVHSLWSGAEISRVDDYNIFHQGGFICGAWVMQSARFILPIRTYVEIDSDTFLSILGGLAKINEFGEGGAIQMIVKPIASKDIKKQIFSAIRLLRKGGRLKDILSSSILPDIGDILSPEVKSSPASPKNQGQGSSLDKLEPKIIEESAIKAMEMKASKPLFEVNIRLLVSSASELQSEEILNGLIAGFSQFGAPERNELKIIKPRNVKNIAHQFAFRNFDQGHIMILNSEELSSMFHFPTPFTEIPRLKSLKSKQAPPPAILSRDGIMIGESIFRGDKKEVRISGKDRGRHVYLVGQTGTGKSTLITNMVSQDINEGKGVAVIDPHGDLIETVLSRVPKSRSEDIIIFNPADLERPTGINMLEFHFNKPEEKTFIVNEIISIFDKLYDLKVTGGPMFEQYMRNALLLLMEDEVNEPATLIEVPRIFTDAGFRKRKLDRIKNPIVIDFWQKEAEKAGGEAALANITPYITSKFNTFTANDYMRLIMGQEKSAFDFRKVMDEGKVLLVNLSKGRIGDINANLLGMIFVGKILMAALSRVDIAEEERRDFNLYIDEFQNFTTDSIATILSEARKYRLNLVIAHQFIAQLSEKIRDAVFGNVGSVVAFRVGVQDADFLVKQFGPVFNEQDLSNIDNFNAYVKLLIQGETAKPFNIKTLPAEKGSLEVSSALHELSRMKYGMPREQVEAGIFRRLRN